MRQELEIEGWGRAPAAVAVVHAPSSSSALTALLAELDPATVSVVSWGTDPTPAKEAEALDIVRRAGFRPEPCVDGARLEAGAVYLVPADRRVWFQGPCLRVAAPSPHERLPFDRVLQSLAREWGERSIVMAPEPLGTDGERGLHAVRQAGGDVRVARAIASDRAMAPGALCEEEGDADAPVSRTTPRSQRAGAPSFRVQRLFPCSPLVVERLRVAALLAVQRAAARDRVRAWVPACKTGGLAYAVAMLLHDAVARVGLGQRVQVFGTDPDEEALAVARAGRYPLDAAASMDPRLRAEYLREEDGAATFTLTEALRDACFFSSHKLPRHAPFSRIDLLVCQRVFEGVAPSQRDDVVNELWCALRDEGVLFALDHRQHFLNGCFELQPEGHLRPRPVRVWARPWPPAPEPAPPALHPSPLPPRAELPVRPDLDLLVEAIGSPLLLLDEQLRVLHVSEAARRRFGLSPGTASALEELAPRLPGRSALLHAAERALATAATSEFAVSAGARAYLVRVSSGVRATGRVIALLFTDVTSLEAATDRAASHRHQQAAVARLGELALSGCRLSALFDEALDALVNEAPVGRLGVIVECREDVPPLAVAASRGLGPDPLTALRQAGAPLELIERVVERASGGDRLQRAEVWSAPGVVRAPAESGEWPCGSALPPLEEGAAWPIFGEGVLLGVLALYTSRSGVDAAEHQCFVQGVTHVLAAAIVRERGRQRLELEHAADGVIAGAADLATLGRGLVRALRPALGASSLEIWCAAPEPAPLWQQHFPELAPAAVPPWPAELLARDTPMYRAWLGSDRPSELWLAVPGGAQPAAVLRASGVALRAPHRELAAGLTAVARRLAPFFERLRVQRGAPLDEAARHRALVELEALCEALPVGISIHDRSGAVRHGLHLTHEPWLARLYAEELPVWIVRAIDTGEPIHDIELSVVGGAERRTWLCSVRPLRDEGGAPTGAVVVVHDPGARSAPAEQRPRAESSIESRRWRVAIISDLEDSSALAPLFEAQGYVVERVIHAGDAVRQATLEPPDLVVCDLDSAVLDLPTLIAALRAIPGAARLGVVAISREGGALTRLRVEEAGCDDHLELPVTSTTLSKCLARLSATPRRQPHEADGG